MRFLGEDETGILIEVPNATFASRLDAEYRVPLLQALKSAGCPPGGVRCEVAESAGPNGSPAATKANKADSDAESDPLSSSYSFDSFVVGPSNRYAYAAACAVSDPGVAHSPYSPLLIYGDVGLGKTHLLQSVAKRIRERNPEIRLLYTKGEAFTRRVVNAVRTNELYGFRDRCMMLDVLLVDDLQFIAGLDRFGRSTEEFFHTLNALADRGRQVVVTANAHPQDIQNLDARVKNRLESGLATDIGRPSWETRVAIIERKASTLRISLPDGAAENIASRYKNNVRELEGALNRIVATSMANGSAISGELVEKALSGVAPRRGPRASVHQVMVAASDAFGVQLLRLRGPQRTQDLVLARHVAMYVCREVTGRTLQEIGRAFHRDHSSVAYGIRKVEDRCGRDPGLDRLVESLIARLR